jgi:hypothetical protein
VAGPRGLIPIGVWAVIACTRRGQSLRASYQSCHSRPQCTEQSPTELHDDHPIVQSTKWLSKPSAFIAIVHNPEPSSHHPPALQRSLQSPVSSLQSGSLQSGSLQSGSLQSNSLQSGSLQSDRPQPPNLLSTKVCGDELSLPCPARSSTNTTTIPQVLNLQSDQSSVPRVIIHPALQ